MKQNSPYYPKTARPIQIIIPQIMPCRHKIRLIFVIHRKDVTQRHTILEPNYKSIPFSGYLLTFLIYIKGELGWRRLEGGGERPPKNQTFSFINIQ